VRDAKILVDNARLHVVGVGAVRGMPLAQQALVRALGKARLLVQQRKQAEFALHEVEALAIVNPVNVRPAYALFVVLQLLQ